MPLTLKELIRGFRRPDLGSLFVLASTLAQCISAFHTAGWLHKNISAHNVLFFDSQLAKILPSNYLAEAHERGRNRIPAPRNEAAGTRVAVKSKPVPTTNHPVSPAPRKFSLRRILSRPRLAEERNRSPHAASPPPPLPVHPLLSASQPSLGASSNVSLISLNEKSVSMEPPDALKKPYVVGFNHTRENETAALTTEASPDPAQRLYQHHGYLGKRPGEGFHAQYDWYSLGVVLLEIGLWQTVEEMTPKLTGQEARTYWLSRCVPRLSSTMGTTYQEAVRLSLECAPGDAGSIAEIVVRNLKKCYA